MNAPWYRRSVATAGRVMMEAALRQVARGAEKSVRIDTIEIREAGPVAASEFQLVYRLRSEHPPSGRGLVFDCRGAASVLHISCGVARNCWISGQELVRLDLNSGEAWDAAVVVFTIRMPASGSPQYLVAPEWLPRILSRDPDEPSACEKILIHSGATRERLVGSLAMNLGDGTSPEFAQVVLAHRPHAAFKSAGEHVSIAPELAAGLDTREVGRVHRLLTNTLEFLAGIAGVEPSVSLALLPLDSLHGASAMAYGAFMPVSAGALGIGMPNSAPSDFTIAHRLAGVWWGGGCRITGRGGAELEGALRGAMALLWLQALDERAQLTRQISHIERLARRSVGGDSLRHAQGLARQSPTARNTLALYHELAGAPESRPALRDLTRSSWGHYVPAAVVQNSLAKAGVRLSL